MQKPGGEKNFNIIVGGGSQSGESEFKHHLLTGESTIGTSREELFVYKDGGYETIVGKGKETGLKLTDRDVIKKGVDRIIKAGGDELLEADKINVSLHSMDMNPDFNTQYGKEFLETLLKLLSKETKTSVEDIKEKISVIFISYDYKNGNTPYPAAKNKEKLENSLLKTQGIDTAIVNFDISDSPSAKALGPTYLGTVGSFVSFLESGYEVKNKSLKSIKERIKNFLGEDYDKLIQILNIYPLSGEVKDGQVNLKELDEEKYTSTMNILASYISGGKLGYISGIISDLLRDLSTAIYIENRDLLTKSQNDKFSFKWNELFKIIDDISEKSDKPEGVIKFSGKLEEIIEDTDSELEKKLDPNTNKDKKKVLVFRELNRGSDNRYADYSYDINELYINSIHASGITAAVMQEDLVRESGLLNEDEDIKSIATGISIYTGEDIRIMREGNEITIVKLHTSKKLAKLRICKQNKEVKKEATRSGEKEVFEPLSIKSNQTNFSNEDLPHSEAHFQLFVRSIPREIFGIEVGARSMIKEYIGMNLYNGLFKNPKNIEIFKERFEKFKLKLSDLRGIFRKTETKHTSPMFDELVEKCRSPQINITKAWTKNMLGVDMAFIKVETIDDNGDLIAEHVLTIV